MNIDISCRGFVVNVEIPDSACPAIVAEVTGSISEVVTRAANKVAFPPAFDCATSQPPVKQEAPY